MASVAPKAKKRSAATKPARARPERDERLSYDGAPPLERGEQMTTEEAVAGMMRSRRARGRAPLSAAHAASMARAQRLSEHFAGLAVGIARGGTMEADGGAVVDERAAKRAADQRAHAAKLVAEVDRMWLASERKEKLPQATAFYLLDVFSKVATVVEAKRYITPRFPDVTADVIESGFLAWGTKAHGRWKRMCSWTDRHFFMSASARSLYGEYREWCSRTDRKPPTS